MEALAAFLVAVAEDVGRFWPLLTVIGAFFAAAAAGAFIPILQQDKSFAQIRDWAVKPGLAARYSDLITSGLRVAGRFYGPGLWPSWRGYGACLVVAFVYPVFLWLAAWAAGVGRAVGGPGAPGP